MARAVRMQLGRSCRLGLLDERKLCVLWFRGIFYPPPTPGVSHIHGYVDDNYLIVSSGLRNKLLEGKCLIKE